MLYCPSLLCTACRAIDNKGYYDQISRTVERVDEVVKEDVLVMKVGVEVTVHWSCVGIEACRCLLAWHGMKGGVACFALEVTVR